MICEITNKKRLSQNTRRDDTIPAGAWLCREVTAPSGRRVLSFLVIRYMEIDVDRSTKIYYHVFYNGGAGMANYGENGYIDFSQLWTVMEKKELNKQWLKNNGIHSNTVAKLTKNENVTCEVICNLCRLLNVQPGQIMEYKR